MCWGQWRMAGIQHGSESRQGVGVLDAVALVDQEQQGAAGNEQHDDGQNRQARVAGSHAHHAHDEGPEDGCEFAQHVVEAEEFAGLVGWNEARVQGPGKGLHATFKDDQHLFLLLEPALGGELYATYHKYRFHGDVKKAKYYSGTVVYCFDHLRQRNILYRDLKPENLLLDDKGHCKITDMGLAKVVIGKTYTTCGTPDYFAPEVIQQTGMGKGVDWWTLGVLIHELMSGHAPFEANDPMETYQKIVRGDFLEIIEGKIHKFPRFSVCDVNLMFS